MTGTLVNTAAIIAGSLLGVMFHGKLPNKYQKTVMEGLSLAVILIGLQMALSISGASDTLIVIFSMVIGGILGEYIGIEEKLNQVGERLKKRFGDEDTLFVQGFVQASLIYCVGAMAIMGAIQEGINGDPSILLTKSLLDGVSSVAFAATSGVGVAFSALPVLIYQGGITLLASAAESFLTQDMIRNMTAVGGLLIVAIGFNVLGVTRIKAGNILPALVVAITLSALVF